MSIKPETQIEPILIELNDIIPGDYYINQHFKKQCIKVGIDGVWSQYLDIVKGERHITIIGIGSENERFDAKNALILYSNWLFVENGVEAFFDFVLFLIDSYTFYSKKKIKVDELKESFILIGVSEETCQRLDQYGLGKFHVGLSDTSSVINDNERIEEIKHQIEKAVAEHNYNLIITLVYTLVEGVLKGYLKENDVSYNRKDEITTLAKLVKTHIQNNNSSKFVEKKALHQITTIVDVVNELRNQCSASHCDEKSDFVTAIFVRDLGYSLANVLINSLESAKDE
ncbi:MAG: hypothetical protein IJE43_13010 [Alphaproteobacteria bacterium]|nr:hypothetical protein [Alphaproteobacteria bacterium]